MKNQSSHRIKPRISCFCY